MKVLQILLAFALFAFALILFEAQESESAEISSRPNSNSNNNNNGDAGNLNLNANRVRRNHQRAHLRNLRRNHNNHNNHNKSKFPLKADGPRRKSRRTSECRLGKTVHEIGDQWNPDLGEPFGKMHCIECSCDAVQRKRKIVGRIRCRNVKNECPKLDCYDAISIPGQCCKVCAANKESEKAIPSDIDDVEDINSENNKEYSALLTPRSSTLIKSSTGLGEPMTTGLASGRFMFLHRNLYFSFVYNNDLGGRPKYVQFVDAEGNVVEEQDVTLNNYQEETKKICGVWRKLPRVYRKLLKEEKLWVALVTEKINNDNDRFLAGLVAKTSHIMTELYSSLLEPSSQVGTGGMAIIAISPSTGSAYLNVVFNGDFDEERDISIGVRISDASGEGVQENVKIPKISYDTNSIEVRTILEHNQLQSLSRGNLFIVVYSPKNPDFKLIGFIQSRVTCDIFDTVLAPEDGSQIHGSGLAWAYPLPDTSWSYNIQLPPGELNPISIKLETGRKVLEELSFTVGNNLTREIVSGIMSARYFQLLYEQNLFLTLETEEVTLRGKLMYRGFGDAQQADAPLLLQPGNRTFSSSGSSNSLSISEAGQVEIMPRAQGLVWIGIDSDCGLNYQLTLSDRPQSDLMRLEIMEMPGLELKGLPVRSYILDNFESSEHEGIYTEIDKYTFPHIKAGDALFKVVRVNDSNILATSVIKNVRVPNSCLPFLNNEIPLLEEVDSPIDDDRSRNTLQNKCYHDGKIRDELSQWTANNDTCQICTCYKGQTKCEQMVCPKLNCPNPVLLTGECCRSCLSTEKPDSKNRGVRGCNVEGESRFHPAGSSWHPYIPPNGFMVCTTCTCSADTLKVKCTREECPLLNCKASEAVYPRPLACCKVCPVKKADDLDIMDDDIFTDVVKKAPSEAEVLGNGGCKFQGTLHPNNDEWNHRVEPFGYIPCVLCSCKSGETKCGRKKCPILDCEVKIQDEGECCPRCSSKQFPPTQSKFLSKSLANPVNSQQSTLGRHRKTSPTKHRTKYNYPSA